ncbi:MAG: bifunctional (p)ppGpp synthetase/guanosine-3',5'-bis(diphosphate) 3'-pyrophosphohydrolase [Clostridia bacterium]|nr:bifunctional (p)ppGpp synthetase/guanosine-3',5'-bis(diphosphate) 3'-pyrophosphohydrolase [Clostridia bacterium]
MYQEELSKLLEKLKLNNPNANTDLVTKAFWFCVEKHKGQKRVSGEDYATHPIAVANILAEMEMDSYSVCAALLHDVVEDTEVNQEEIEEEFGDIVALLVYGVTKLGKIENLSKEEAQMENLRRMFFAMAEDVRVILIKLADRLHNMRTMKAMPEPKQREKARETLEIYAPLAHRLGISRIKSELEDLSLKFIDPIGYYEIVDKIAQKQEEREQYILEIIEILKKRLSSAGIDFHIAGRAKHFYSIYRKMFMQNKTIDEIYDLFAVRIIVDSVEHCYAILGLVHELFTPVPGRFKDYIAMPKPNMYQSLHTTMIGPKGTPFEIQIRTWEMHHTAENGIAAHWKYKEGKNGADENDEKLEWIKNLLDIQKNTTNNEEVMNALKIDMFSDEVFVFTPKGKVVSLPAGATPIDFAYAIHTAIGNKMQGAKVNGKIVTLDYELQNGDIIEIHTANNGRPNMDWVKIAKTSQARNKINQWFRKENREENLEKGREILEKELKKANIPMEYLEDDAFTEPILRKYGFRQMEDMIATIGYGSPNGGKFITKFKELAIKRYNDEHKETEEFNPIIEIKQTVKPNQSGICVEGIDNCLIKVSRCCSPVPGDSIVGYITRGRGVAVHRADCINMRNLENQGNSRFIRCWWAGDVAEKESFRTDLCVTAEDRAGLLMDIMGAVSSMNLKFSSINARSGKNNVAIIDISFDVSSTSQLDIVIKKIGAVSGVISVQRRRL